MRQVRFVGESERMQQEGAKARRARVRPDGRGAWVALAVLLAPLFVVAGIAGCHRSSTNASGNAAQGEDARDASAQDSGQARVPIRRPRPHQPREVPDDSTGPATADH